MAFSLFTKKSPHQNLVLLIDIGSASVGAALAEIGVDKAPHIFATAREEILFQEKLTSAEFLRAMNHSLLRVLKSILKKTRGTKNSLQVFCSLSSPWFLLKNRHSTITHGESFEINPSVLDAFLNEEIVRLKEELKKTLPSEDIKIVEKKIIQIKLNGYEIKNPYGKTATRVDLAMIIGVSSKQVIQRIERTVANFFHSATIHFNAFPVAAFSAIRDIFPTEKTFLFIDITGEGTDVSLISNDSSLSTVSFPRGKNFLIREISARFLLPHEAALSVLNMYNNGTLDAKRHGEVELLLLQAEKDWLARFEKTLISFSVEGTLPQKIFFMADPDIAVFFESILNKTKEVHPARTNFVVQYLDQSVFGKFASFESETIRDPFLTVEALLAAKIVPQLKNNS